MYVCMCMYLYGIHVQYLLFIDVWAKSLPFNLVHISIWKRFINLYFFIFNFNNNSKRQLPLLVHFVDRYTGLHRYQLICSKSQSKWKRWDSNFEKLFSFIIIFKWTLSFRTVLGAWQNWAEGVEIFHVPHFYTCIASLVINTPHQNDTFIMIDEHTLTYHYPKSIVLFFFLFLRFYLFVFRGEGREKEGEKY